MFILSTYGEGDPPDNALRFDEWLQTLARNNSIRNLRFATLGLGNSNYKHYNRFATRAYKALQDAGAVPLLDLFLADDAQGLTQEVFVSWKTKLFESFIHDLGIFESPNAYEPVLKITPSDVPGDNRVMSQPVNVQMRPKTGISAVYFVTVTSIRNITPKAPRTTLHIDVDISKESKLKYDVGDHLAVWPDNSLSEASYLCDILGLSEPERHQSIMIHSEDPDIQVLWPQPVTLLALFRFHLDIASLVSRDLIIGLKQFARNEDVKTSLDEILRDYQHLCATRRMTLVSVLQSASPEVPWNIPLPFVLENLPPQKPRYYSIGSTPVVNPRTISFTVAVKDIDLGGSNMLRGLASSYFVGMQLPSDKANETTTTSVGLWCSVRKSKFKPPVSHLQPIIMVANGSGIAPFIGFLCHRLRSFKLRGEVGKMMLFYGCQNEEVHLYKTDIEEIQAAFGGQLQVLVAYSRSGSGYVQDQVKAQYASTMELLCVSNAYLYICGSAAMARGVREVLLTQIKVHKGWSDKQTEDFETAQLKIKKWQLDVWG